VLVQDLNNHQIIQDLISKKFQQKLTLEASKVPLPRYNGGFALGLVQTKKLKQKFKQLQAS